MAIDAFTAALPGQGPVDFITQAIEDDACPGLGCPGFATLKKSITLSFSAKTSSGPQVFTPRAEKKHIEELLNTAKSNSWSLSRFFAEAELKERAETSTLAALKLAELHCHRGDYVKATNCLKNTQSKDEKQNNEILALRQKAVQGLLNASQPKSFLGHLLLFFYNPALNQLKSLHQAGWMEATLGLSIFRMGKGDYNFGCEELFKPHMLHFTPAREYQLHLIQNYPKTVFEKQKVNAGTHQQEAVHFIHAKKDEFITQHNEASSLEEKNEIVSEMTSYFLGILDNYRSEAFQREILRIVDSMENNYPTVRDAVRSAIC